MPRIGSRLGAALALAACLTAIGCGRDQPSSAGPPPPFKMGRPTVVATDDPAQKRPPQFSIAITSPEKGEVFKPGSRVEVTCALTVPPDGAMPWSIDISVIDRKNRIVDARGMVPETDLGGGRYTLAAAVRLPAQPGVYRLEAEAFESVIFEPRDSKYRSERGRITESVEVRAQ